MLASLFALVPVAIAVLNVAEQTSNTSFSVRLVEWMRDNGARGLVNRVESIYYTLSAPATGGPPLKRLPKQAGVAVAVKVKHPGARSSLSYYPPPIAPLIHPALPGEGVWHATFTGVHGPPPVLVASFRSDLAYPQMVAGVAWIDHSLTTTWLYPGRLEPSVPLPSRGPMEVPASLRPRLVATFNSGFKLSDSGGGFAENGHTYAPLEDGLATFIRRRDGSVDVIGWEGGPDVRSDIVYARQNLPLIVDHGVANPNLSDGPQWGATLGNAIRVWRSGVGVDRHGNLIYAAANDQTVGSLAAIMTHAGAVRAMQLDINAYWPSFITYKAPGALGAANLLPDMTRSPERYLTPDDRDFFAVYLR